MSNINGEPPQQAAQYTPPTTAGPSGASYLRHGRSMENAPEADKAVTEADSDVATELEHVYTDGDGRPAYSRYSSFS